MGFKLPPPPVGNEVSGPAFRDWFFKLQNYLNTIGSILFTELDFTGSNLTSIQTRNHNDLQNIEGGDGTHYYHLSQLELNKLRGNQFMMGLDGSDGEDGFVIPGPQGPQGIQGPAGSGGSGTGSIGPKGEDGEDGQDNYIYLTQTINTGGGSGLTHPQVLTRVSFRM